MAAVFVDVEKAFDRVWHEGLRYKLINLNLPDIYIRWISDFLRSRSIKVKINNIKCKSLHPTNGVPQGSSLSPLLFLIYVADIPNLGTSVSLSQFADDIAIWHKLTNKNPCFKMLQKALDILKTWCNKCRIGLNAPINLYPLKINDIPIPYCKKVKFIGIVFDTRLIDHAENIIKESFGILNQLYKLKGINYGPSSKNLISLFNTYIRSKMEYGSPCTII